MLDQSNGNIMTAWQDHYAKLFGRMTLCMQHRLHVSPLFTDKALINLIENADRQDYHVNYMDGDVRREGEFGDLSGRQIMKAVKTGKIWINLRAPHLTNPAYGQLLADIYNEFEGHVPGLETFKQNMTILISSPNIKVKYHVDVPGQSLWQVRGRKRVFAYPAIDPFLTQNAIEKVVINEAHETDIQYQKWFDDYALIKDLEPGEMLHWPLNFPHRVENHDCVNVSITTEHWTRELRNAYAVNYANGILRKFGFKNLSRPIGGPGLWARLGLAGLVKYSGIQNKDAKPYKIDFQVDPNAPNGIRDIESHELSKS